MDYSNIKIAIKKPIYFEIIQNELFEYADFINKEMSNINFIDGLMICEIILKLNLRLRTIIERNQKQKSLALSVSESCVLIKAYNYKPRQHSALETAVLHNITIKLQQEIFSRLTN